MLAPRFSSTPARTRCTLFLILGGAGAGEDLVALAFDLIEFGVEVFAGLAGPVGGRPVRCRGPPAGARAASRRRSGSREPGGRGTSSPSFTASSARFAHLSVSAARLLMLALAALEGGDRRRASASIALLHSCRISWTSCGKDLFGILGAIEEGVDLSHRQALYALQETNHLASPFLWLPGINLG